MELGVHAAFGASDQATENRGTWHVPDVETLFVQRKVSGSSPLAARLHAKVDVVGLARSAVGQVERKVNSEG